MKSLNWIPSFKKAGVFLLADLLRVFRICFFGMKQTSFNIPWNMQTWTILLWAQWQSYWAIQHYYRIEYLYRLEGQYPIQLKEIFPSLTPLTFFILSSTSIFKTPVVSLSGSTCPVTMKLTLVFSFSILNFWPFGWIIVNIIVLFSRRLSRILICSSLYLI